jgi:hypothetical protein
MKSSSRSARKLPPCIPHELLKDHDIIWDDSLAARKDRMAFNKALKDLERRWIVWRRLKKVIEDDERRFMLAETERAGREIDRDRQNQIIDDLEAKINPDREESARLEQTYLDQLAELLKKQSDRHT